MFKTKSTFKLVASCVACFMALFLFEYSNENRGLEESEYTNVLKSVTLPESVGLIPFGELVACSFLRLP